MAEMADSGKKGNYDCEILSLIVLSILSALSHFWYILFAIYAGIIFWGAAVLLGHFLTSAARTFPLYGKRMLIKIPSRNHEPN